MIGVLLYEQAQIADEDEAAGGRRLDVFLLDRIPASSFNKQETAFAAAIRWPLQILGEIEGGLVGLPFVL